MRKWEDIVKDKLEEADGALLESVFAEFQTRRNASASASAPKRLPLLWVAIPAVAAALAAVLFLRQPAAVPDSGIQLIQQPTVPVVLAVDSVIVDEPIKMEPTAAHALKQRIVKQFNAEPKVEVETESEREPEVEAEDIANIVPEETETVDKPTIVSPSPFIPESAQPNTVDMNVELVAGSVAGGGGLLAAAILPTIKTEVKAGAVDYDSRWSYMDSSTKYDYEMNGHKTGDNQLVGSPVHYFPLKLGLSARIPVAKKLFITTGVDYSLYRSTFQYVLSGEEVQQAHYLGIPIRLDWAFVSGKLFDVYLGGGLEGDICVGATFAGYSIQKDGFGLSLQGAGGIQLNATRHLGFYVEPQLSWRIPIGSPVLETYRTVHPLQFNVAAGIRITIGK